MSDLSYGIAAARQLLRPVAEYALWPAYFVITRAVNQEPLYLAALFLLLAADLIDSPLRDRALFRDLAAGTITVLTAVAFSDPSGVVVGAIVGLGATLRLSVKLARAKT